MRRKTQVYLQTCHRTRLETKAAEEAGRFGYLLNVKEDTAQICKGLEVESATKSAIKIIFAAMRPEDVRRLGALSVGAHKTKRPPAAAADTHPR